MKGEKILKNEELEKVSGGRELSQLTKSLVSSLEDKGIRLEEYDIEEITILKDASAL